MVGRIWKNPLCQAIVFLAVNLVVFKTRSVLLAPFDWASAAGVSLNSWRFAIDQLFWAAFFIGLAAVMLKSTGAGNLSSLGLTRTRFARELAIGSIAGVAVCSLVALTLFAGRIYKFYAFREDAAMLAGLVLAFAIAVLEEVIYRGFILQHVERATGTLPALVITGIAFGAAHMPPWYDWQSFWTSVYGCLAITLETTLLFGGLYLLTRRLWLVIGFHAAWNFMECQVFGMSWSWRSVSMPLMDARMDKSLFLAGGNFGPEAGIVPLVVLTLLGAVLLFAVKRKDLLRSAERA